LKLLNNSNSLQISISGMPVVEASLILSGITEEGELSPLAR